MNLYQKGTDFFNLTGKIHLHASKLRGILLYMYINRQISKNIEKSKKSVLLIGPRQTGKSTILQNLKPELSINLADEQVYFQHLKDPSLLRQVVGKKKLVLVDEIQRIPSLLNTVQALIDEDKNRRLLLTGSSARKLKRGNANLLPGRVIYYELGPLNYFEIGENEFELKKALTRGLLPGVYLDTADDWKDVLQSYVALYLKEEVQAEALTRDIQGFSRFFDVTIAKSGQHIDFTKYASQAMIERNTARRYFDILIDTLILDPIEPFAKSTKRRLIQHPRFYCFDVGVLNSCLGSWQLSQDRVGLLFEHFIIQQIRSLQKSLRLNLRLSTYRTENNAEVDLIVEKESDIFAIEIKASKNIGPSDLRGLKSFSEFYGKKVHSWIFYLGDQHRELDNIEIFPWAQGLQALFQNFAELDPVNL